MTILIIIYALVTILGLIFHPRALSNTPAGIAWTWATWPVLVVLVVWLVVMDAIEGGE